MDQNTLYRDIAGRCDGDIYLGVVGPVRTGKSTFIKRFMELLVLPNLQDAAARERAVDELPQSGAGRTIMTTQPRFVPDEAAQLRLKDGASARVRLVDCVGYLIPGVLGLNEGEGARMVRTPWYDHDIPFEEAAELGTRKVIQEHATIGAVVTTDGSVVDMPRSAYEAAEARVVGELRALGKPFIVVLNVKNPSSPETLRLRDSLTEQYGVPVQAVNAQSMSLEDLNGLLTSLLFEFPIREARIQTPAWLTALSEDHWLGQSVMESVNQAAANMRHVRDHEALRQALDANEYAEDALPIRINLNDGTLEYRLNLKDGLFYQVLGEASGETIDGEAHLFDLMRQLVAAKKEYDKVAEALAAARETGYGMVPPTMDELALESPELVKQGPNYSVRLKASAPSLQLVRADIQTEVTPFAGSQSQSEALAASLKAQLENGDEAVWETEIFGKTLGDLVREGMNGKLKNLPEDAQGKLREALEKIINEGSGGMICIML
ncbi:MAG: stage IV sporulation protein A [Clostridia bacterium]|nr:stage IV sporulation protein A [Clostridia bacterium]